MKLQGRSGLSARAKPFFSGETPMVALRCGGILYVLDRSEALRLAVELTKAIDRGDAWAAEAADSDEQPQNSG
jgi:hypothetical protein